MRDLIIVIPGIMGSVLQRDDKDLWKPGLGMATKILRHKQWARSLTLVGEDDPADVGPVDGVIPSALVDTQAIVPGLISIDGYSELHGSLERTFGRDLHEGDPLQPEQRLDGRDPESVGCPNYYRFAYDWRRDIRSSALRLHDLIETALPKLRAQRSPDAEVIILAHSMGGLVGRYYMYGINPRDNQPFDGWRNVRELFTMGTPFRGSPSALGHLHHGFRKLFVDFSAALRSYTGVYQLLPRYPMIEKPGLDRSSEAPRTREDYLYPYELNIEGLDADRAKAVYDTFHLTVDDRIDALGGDHRLKIVPDIGFGHSTVNSAIITDDGVELQQSVPDYLNQSFTGGDGTVPLISAIPLELDQDRSALRYTNQQHGSLQVDQRTLSTEIENRLRQLQATTQDARSGDGSVDVAKLPSINLDGPQYALAGEETVITPGLTGVDGDPPLKLSIIDLATSRPVGETQTCVPGQAVALPTVEGDYLIDAFCPAARLESRSLFAVLGDGQETPSG